VAAMNIAVYRAAIVRGHMNARNQVNKAQHEGILTYLYRCSLGENSTIRRP
jgi:hypothetical protein